MSTPRSISAHLDAVLALASTPPAESAPVDASLIGGDQRSDHAPLAAVLVDHS